MGTPESRNLISVISRLLMPYFVLIEIFENITCFIHHVSEESPHLLAWFDHAARSSNGDVEPNAGTCGSCIVIVLASPPPGGYRNPDSTLNSTSKVWRNASYYCKILRNICYILQHILRYFANYFTLLQTIAKYCKNIAQYSTNVVKH